MWTSDNPQQNLLNSRFLGPTLEQWNQNLWKWCTEVYIFNPSYPGGSMGKKKKKFHLQCRRCRRLGFDFWVGKIPWRRAWQPTPVFLPGECHAQRSLAGYSPWGQKELYMTERLNWTETVAHQAPLSMGFSRQGYWSGLPCLPPGDLPDPGIEPASPVLTGRFFTTVPPGKPQEQRNSNYFFQSWVLSQVTVS